MSNRQRGDAFCITVENAVTGPLGDHAREVQERQRLKQAIEITDVTRVPTWIVEREIVHTRGILTDTLVDLEKKE